MINWLEGEKELYSRHLKEDKSMKEWLLETNHLYKDAWKKSYKNEFCRDEIPDGEYFVNIEWAELKKSRSGNSMIEWHMTVLLGEHKGEVIRKYDVLIDQTRISNLGVDIEKLGFSRGEYLEMIDTLSQIRNIRTYITLKTENNFRNIYFINKNN